MVLSKFSHSFIFVLCLHLLSIFGGLYFKQDKIIVTPPVGRSGRLTKINISRIEKRLDKAEKRPPKRFLKKRPVKKRKLKKVAKAALKKIEKLPELRKSPVLNSSSHPTKVVDLEEIEKYALELRDYIDRNKAYPRLAKRLKQSGDVEIQLRINKSGQFQRIIVSHRSPYPLLNQAAKKLLEKLQKFKPLPKGLTERSFSIPIRFKL